MAKKKEEQVILTENGDYKEIFDYALNDLNKEYGNIAYILGQNTAPTEIKMFVPTGSTLLDLIIANRPNGGWPVGRISEISSEESVGKSLLIDIALANTQKMGGLAILIDTESARDPVWMSQLGIDVKKLLYFQTDLVEEVFDIIEKILSKVNTKSSNKLITIAVDSIAGMSSKAEMAAEYTETPVIGEKARLISRAMRKTTNLIAEMNVCLLLSNQLRYKIGERLLPWMDPFITSGGKSTSYHSSIRVRLTKGVTGKVDDEAVSVGVHAKVTKNRIAPPLRTAHFNINFGSGIRDEEDWAEFLSERDLIEKASAGRYGSKYKFIFNNVEQEIYAKDWFNKIKQNKELRNYFLNLLEKALIIKNDIEQENIDNGDNGRETKI